MKCTEFQMSDGGVTCECCNIQLSSSAQLEIHEKGKKHQKRLEEIASLSDLSSRSIYVYGLPLNAFKSKEQVHEIFSRYGAIDKISFNLTKGSFAIIDFCEKESAHNAIEDRKVRIGEHVALIKRREMNFSDHNDFIKICRPDFEQIIEKLSSVDGSFDNQADEIIRSYCLDTEDLIERQDAVVLLTRALGNYLTCGVRVVTFGSSITTIGFRQADLDAIIFFDTPLCHVGPRAMYELDKFSLLTADAGTIRLKKVGANEIGRLSPTDRVGFFSKILNDIRRTGEVPISNQYPLLDARCPLIRFHFARKFVVDLSIDNTLGFTKSCFIRDIIQSDSYSTIRRFMVIVRFWVFWFNSLHDEEIKGGGFGAYTLSMLCIIFLQQSSIIPAVKYEGARFFYEWCLDYQIDSVDLSNVSLSQLIRNFFIWFVLLDLKDRILCTRSASIMNLEEFYERFQQESVKQSFTVSFLNIQDPIELSHNVSQFVTKNYLSMVRKEMTLAISRSKQHPQNLVALLHPNAASSKSSPRHADKSMDTQYQCIITANNNLSLKEWAERVKGILINLLCVQEYFQVPCAKRQRHYEEAFVVVENLELKFVVWMGRRQMRRRVLEESKSASLCSIESLITKAIVAKCSPLESVLQFRFVVCFLEANISLKFECISGSKLDFGNFVHFANTFIPKFLQDSTAYTINEDVEME